jgi:hypothetical protein
MKQTVEGGFHEPLISMAKVRGSSNRAFGLTFGAVFLVLALPPAILSTGSNVGARSKLSLRHVGPLQTLMAPAIQCHLDGIRHRAGQNHSPDFDRCGFCRRSHSDGAPAAVAQTEPPESSMGCQDRKLLDRAETCWTGPKEYGAAVLSDVVIPQRILDVHPAA